MKKKLTAIFCMTAMLLCAIPASAVEDAIETNIYWNDVHQEIDGFGGAVNPYAAEHVLHNKGLADFLFDPENGLGFSILRTVIQSGSEEGTSSVPRGSHQNKDGSWNWTKDSEQLTVMETAQKYGTQIISCPWSPPAWMKTTGDTTTGTLNPEYYDDYANYLTKYVTGYQKEHGVKISALSLQNEPESLPGWDGCLFPPEKMHIFVRDFLKPAFSKAGVDTKIMLNDAANFRFPVKDYPYLLDDATKDSVDIISAHAYWALYDRFPLGKELFKHIWNTETCGLNDLDNSSIEYGLGWAEEVHVLMTVPEVNGFLFWYLVHNYITSEALITCHCDSELIVNKRCWAFGNYSKYIRPGYWRIGADESPVSDVYITAYKDEKTGKCVLVCINDSTEEHEISFNMHDFKAKTMTGYRTSTKENLDNIGTKIVNGNKISASLAPRSVTSYVFDGCESELVSGKLEAEWNSSKLGNAQNYTDNSLSGSGGVYNIGALDNGVEFSHLSAGNALSFQYRSKSAENIKYKLYINNLLITTLSFPSTIVAGVNSADVSWNVNVPKNATVKLVAAEKSDGIILDCMTVYSDKLPKHLNVLSANNLDFSWADSAINMVNDRGILDISSEKAQGSITRGEYFSALIGTLELNAEWTENFLDAYDTKPYYNALGIAKALEIAKGENGMIRAEDFLVREDLFIFTANALKAKGYIEKSRVDITDFSDWNNMSEEAQKAAMFLLSNKIIIGNEKLLDPKGYVSNAVVAVVLSKIVA